MDTMYLPALSPGHGRIAILGAGLMGRLLAVALAREGWSVQVHDAGGPEGEASAARVAAAMLAPLAEAAVSEPAVPTAKPAQPTKRRAPLGVNVATERNAAKGRCSSASATRIDLLGMS